MKVMKMFGPPGTGKTTALLRRLERELRRGVVPERVAFMTFTVAARREAVSRVINEFGFERSQLMHFRTIHSAAFRQMNVPRSAIVTPDKIKYFAEDTNINFSRAAVGDFDADVPIAAMMSSDIEGDRMMAYDHLRRHRLQTFEEGLTGWEERPVIFDHFTQSYEAWKASEALYDFTDILDQASNPLDIDVAFIDEAQDLSLLQWETVNRLCARAKRAYIAGDDDQAIFAWAGADPSKFVDMSADLSIVLGRSYRVPTRVHDIAESIVHTIKHRQPKQWRPRHYQGDVRWETEVKYWDPPTDGSVFVLARNKKYLLAYEDRLRELGLPYERHDAEASSVHRWAPAVVGWEARRRGEAISEDLEMAINQAVMPQSMVDPSDYWYDALTRIPERERLYMRAVLRALGNAGLVDEPRIMLSTIHGVKGRQAEHVVLDVGMSPICKRTLYEGDSDSEARVAYVGVTRARSSFTLVGDHHPLIPVRLLGKG